MSFENYRTPEQLADDEADWQRINALLERAVSNSASALAAAHYGEPQETVDHWIDAVWNELRNELSPEDRLYAIIRLLAPRARAACRRLLEEAS